MSSPLCLPANVKHFRIAPTPSGYLHRGNGVNFLLTAAWAHVLQGNLVLRVDDLDAQRVRPEYVTHLSIALHQLLPKLAARLWSQRVYQSTRLPQYDRTLEVLRRHKLVYACTCSRKQVREARVAQAGEVAAHETSYPGTCRTLGLPLDTPKASWRLRVSAGTTASWQEGLGLVSTAVPMSDDFIVRQRNGHPSYQLASLVDDIDFGITHVVRGEDLRASTARQLVLATALAPYESAFAAFAKTCFWHHKLLLDEQGRKLSKSSGDNRLAASPKVKLERSQIAAMALGIVDQHVAELRLQDPQAVVEAIVVAMGAWLRR